MILKLVIVLCCHQDLIIAIISTEAFIEGVENDYAIVLNLSLLN